MVMARDMATGTVATHQITILHMVWNFATSSGVEKELSTEPAIGPYWEYTSRTKGICVAMIRPNNAPIRQCVVERGMPHIVPIIMARDVAN